MKQTMIRGVMGVGLLAVGLLAFTPSAEAAGCTTTLYHPTTGQPYVFNCWDSSYNGSQYCSSTTQNVGPGGNVVRYWSDTCYGDMVTVFGMGVFFGQGTQTCVVQNWKSTYCVG